MPYGMSSSDLELPANARALLAAVVAIGTDLDIHSVLRRIVRSACEITGAKYGALGVLGVLGNAGGLVDFITYGLADDERLAIGELPLGHGILGLLIDQPRPLRLRHLQEHPESYGFPPNHPPMERFLGVPVRIRGTVFGNLYLTEKEGGENFSEQDEKLVEALATAAGFVIDNARAYGQSEQRRQWLEATSKISVALQTPGRLDGALRQIAISTRRVARASFAAVVQHQESGHSISAYDGALGDELPALVEALDDQVTLAETDAQMVVVPYGADLTVILVPLRVQLAGTGVLLVGFDRQRALEAEETELLASFADQASLALDRAQAVSDRQELMLISDRDRIARDLHDLVIQRLFATGLQLQGARRIASGADVKERIDNAVSELDVTIRDIRSTIFELQHSDEPSLRADVRAVVKEYGRVLGFTPMVRTRGPVDTAVPRHIAEQLSAVLREALSNVARHSEADAAVVDVEVDEREILLRVTDNGQGLPAERQESGLRNVRRRAAEHGGAVRLLLEEPHGTRLEWTVPLPLSGSGD
jgi:signal transduction histidine kinase